MAENTCGRVHCCAIVYVLYLCVRAFGSGIYIVCVWWVLCAQYVCVPAPCRLWPDRRGLCSAPGGAFRAGGHRPGRTHALCPGGQPEHSPAASFPLRMGLPSFCPPGAGRCCAQAEDQWRERKTWETPIPDTVHAGAVVAVTCDSVSTEPCHQPAISFSRLSSGSSACSEFRCYFGGLLCCPHMTWLCEAWA